MAIISLGRIDKKLIFIAILTIARMIDLIIAYNISEDYFDSILSSLEEEIGPIIAGIIMMFLFKQKEKKRERIKRSFKYLFILFLLRLVKSGYERCYRYVIKGSEYGYNTIINTINAVEIIMITIGTFLLLNYKYYIHHIISMFIYSAFGIVLDFILGNFSLVNFKYIYIYIIYLINEVLVLCYLKYMMDKLYYHYTETIIYWGIIGLIVKICIFSGRIIYEYKNDLEGIIHNFKIYFTETNVVVIIFLQFCYTILFYASFYVLWILILYYLKPSHTIISDELIESFELIAYEENPNKYYTIIPFILQNIALLFYFEILEFNFLNLNKNTIKNIQMREKKEENERQTISSLIELGEQYYIKDDELKILDEQKRPIDKIEELRSTINSNSIENKYLN